MIVVDTSVWIDFFRGRNHKLIEKMRDLLDQDRVALTAPIRIEILSGVRPQQKPALNRVLSALPVFYPNQETWLKIESLIDEALSKGERFGAMDLLIAAIAQENNTHLWSLDKDFQRMEKLGWIELFDR